MIANAYGTPYYTMNRRGAAMGGLGFMRALGALRGLGACGDCLGWSTDPDTGEVSCTGGYDSASCVQGSGNPGGAMGPTPLPGLSPVSTVNWGNVGSSIAQDFTSIYKAIVPIPPGCTQVQTAQGTSVSCAGANGAAAPSLSLPSSLTSMLPMLLIGAVAFMVLKK